MVDKVQVGHNFKANMSLFDLFCNYLCFCLFEALEFSAINTLMTSYYTSGKISFLIYAVQ